MRGINKKIISLFLAFTIVLTTFGLSSNTSYAASIKLNKTNITLLRKQTSQLKVKNTKKKVTWYSSNKSVATVSKTKRDYSLNEKEQKNIDVKLKYQNSIVKPI